jgi:hypothetical protein
MFQACCALLISLVPLSGAGQPAASPFAVPAEVAQEEAPSFDLALKRGEAALAQGDLALAERWIVRALERERRSLAAWDLRARWAEAADRPDQRAWSLYQIYILSVAQQRDRKQLGAAKERWLAADPLAEDLLALRELFQDELLPLAERYKKEGRPHAAIAVHRELLALDPERTESQEIIEELAAAPDPSLAEFAKPKDLFADVDPGWILEHDREHVEWRDRAKLTRPNYVTHTNAGYRVLLSAAEAMEQMNAFYREFFNFGVDKQGRALPEGGSVPRIELRIFKSREEYLDLGSGPPAEWSGGQFTGGAVETYIGPGGFEETVGTLFHEAAHQFVGLATSAVGWLNEGLASFFEGCRILPNGTVRMNLPANHRLFPLAERMEAGWMASHEDGIEGTTPPPKAPTFRIVLENRYTWGPPWYAPTWGVVYFLYNYQDPVDGRFIYRAAFREFINSSAGRVGDGAVSNFESVVLGNPSEKTKSAKISGDASVALPKTVAELDEVWKDYILGLRDAQSGQNEAPPPYLDWARFALERGELAVAAEHFERGLVNTPEDVDLLEEFAVYLAEEAENPDRAAKLQLAAVALLESAPEPDAKRLTQARRRLADYDPRRRSLDDVHEELYAATLALVERYRAADKPVMAMQIAKNLGLQFGVQPLIEAYGDIAAESGPFPEIWELAYNEVDLDGWNAPDPANWRPVGDKLEARFTEYQPDLFDFTFLTLDRITSGDFSLEAEVLVSPGEGAFGGLVFGRKDSNHFHGLMLFPPDPETLESGDAAPKGYLDLTSFYGSSVFKVWRHNPVDYYPTDEDWNPRRVSTRKFWQTLRLDVVGRSVDVWHGSELVASHEFGDVGVLRGSFGLITGPGTVQFRNVRFLAREADDPAARVERQRRVEALAAQGRGVGGSYLGFVPPFPEVEQWHGAPLAGWEDLGSRIAVLTLWSQDQNDVMPLHEWLVSLESKYAKLGIRFLSIASANDKDTLAEYLKTHAFPGHVGVDRREGFGYGQTFEAYSIDRFNLPRVLLLDLDGRVAWEGDPGFKIGKGWDRREGSYLDAPLEELIAKRQLNAILPWAAEWEAKADTAFSKGDWTTARELLLGAEGFTDATHPAVAEAQARLKLLRNTGAALAPALSSLAREGADPAAAVLVEWVESLGVELSKRELKEFGDVLESERVKQWERCLRDLEVLEKDAARGRFRTEPAALLAELRALEDNLFIGVVTPVLAEAIEADDYEGLASAAARAPAIYLARKYFGWLSS